MRRRRDWLGLVARGLGAASLPWWTAPWWIGPAWAASPAADRAPPPPQAQPMSFPRDFGAHLEAAIEWWYITGALSTEQGREFGFQITFFRSRTPLADRLGRSGQGLSRARPGRLSAPQLLFAHAALTDVQGRQLLHAERLTRWNGQESPAAQASTIDTRLQLDRWQLRRVPGESGSTYRARWDDTDAGFALDLELHTTQAVLLQGRQGYSAKSHRQGLNTPHYSHYYSQPQLRTAGELLLRGQRMKVHGRAWLDHEWSSALLDPDAVGWDWVGLNLDDGSALTVFRLRTADGQALFAGGSLRRPGGAVRAFEPHEVRMVPGRLWRSAATGASYPVEWTLHTPAGMHSVRAVIDDQELDSRASTGTVYWEGLSTVSDPAGARVGMGYLEMTGYASRLIF